MPNLYKVKAPSPFGAITLTVSASKFVAWYRDYHKT